MYGRVTIRKLDAAIGVHLEGALPKQGDGRARCPHRAMGGCTNPHASDMFGHSRRGGDTAPYLQTRGRLGQHGLDRAAIAACPKRQ